VLCFKMLKALLVVVALFAFSAIVSAEKQDNPLACSVCQLVMQFVEGQVTSNVTETKIDAILNKVCSTLHVTAFCQSTILPLVPQILQALQNKESPQVICQQIKICAAQVREVHHHKRIAQGSNPLACGLCQGIINQAETIVQSNASVAVVSKAILKVCAKLDASAFCQANVLPKLPAVLSMIVAKATPAKVCTAIKVCAPNSTAEVHKRGFDLKCSICESVINFARTQLGSDKTTAGVQKALNAACGKVPFAKDVCSGMLAPLVQKIAADLLNNVDTHKVCVKAKMCHSS